MPPKQRSAEYFDGWYADRVATPTVDEIMNRHMGFPPDTRAGVVPAEAIPELAEELRLTPGSTLLDLACGRGAYGLLIAQKAGTLLIGVDFSAQALTEAREQAARMGVNDASFRVGELTAAGLPDASVEAVLCTDAIQFPDEPADAYDEIRRVLKPGGRVVLTCWEPLDRNDDRLSLRVRRANLGAGLRQADDGANGWAIEGGAGLRDRIRHRGGDRRRIRGGPGSYTGAHEEPHAPQRIPEAVGARSRCA